MDRQLKQRVVGAAVLVAFGVIFIPIFLDDGTIDTSVSKVADIPPAPVDDFGSRVVPLDDADINALQEKARAPVTPIALPPTRDLEEAKPDRVAKMRPAPAAQPAAKPPPRPAQKTVEKPAVAVAAKEIALDTAKPGDDAGAWAVQLGSFANDENAKRLIDKLRASGFEAYLERRVEPDSTVFKVRVGPQIRRDEAEKVRQRLEQEFALKGMLLRYR